MYSILIPTYNNPEYLKLCIESILENSYYNTHQFCIHVNGYNQETIDYLTKMNIKYTVTQDNIGPLALNYCINQSKHDKVILTNDDCYFTKNWDYYLHQWEIELSKEFPNYKQIIGYRRAEPKFGSFPPTCDAGKTINEFDITKVNEYISKHSSHIPLTWHMQSLYPKDIFISNPITNEFFPSSCVDLDYMMNFLRYYKNNNIKFLMFTAGDVFVYHFQGISRSNSKIPEVNNGNKFEKKWKMGTESACNLLHHEEDISIDLINKYLSERHNTISTYISCYNSLFYQSTLEQTIRQSLLFSDEIVVVNSEHSTDGTSELLDQLHSEYPNIIRLYTFKEDYSIQWKAVAEKKTFALKKCTKDYCILQDDDECIHEQYASYIKQLPTLCPETTAFRFNTIHFYRSYNHYQSGDNWYNKKIYMVKNIPKIEHGRVVDDPDNFITKTTNTPLDNLKPPNIINTPVTSYHYGWCRNDAVLLLKKHHQETRWWGEDYWNSHKFPFKFDNPEKLSEFRGTHPKYMIPLIKHEQKLNSRHVNEFTKESTR